MADYTHLSLSQRVLRLWLPLVIAGVALVWLGSVLCWGWEYYGLPRLQRPFHPTDHLLRPSSPMGLWFGLVAAVFFVLNLGYLIRKRLIKIRAMGSLRAWMDCHVVTGVVGGVLVAFHSAFAPISALGILASVALLITVMTGLIGRYIYVHVPRSLEGRELEFEQVRAQLALCRDRLERAGVQTHWLHERDVPETQPHGGLLQSFASLMIGDRQRQRDVRQFRQAIRSRRDLQLMAGEILPLVRDFCRHWQWMTRYHQWRGLLASWRFLHRWLAIVMLIVASFHIFIAFRYADLSILGIMR